MNAPDCLRIAGRRIVVDYVNPPIPIRAFDFCAFFEGNDIGDPQGYGTTAAEAIKDLRDKATGEQA